MAVFEKRVANDGALKYRAKVRIKGSPTQSKTFRQHFVGLAMQSAGRKK